MSPANLKDPFGPSCCDGGACAEEISSAQPCGCDPNAKWVCSQHKTAYALSDLICKWKLQIDLLLKAERGTNDPPTAAKLRLEAERLAICIVEVEEILYA